MAIYINICHRKPLISWLLNDETRTSLTREDFSIKLGSGCKQTAAPQSDAGLHHDGKKKHYFSLQWARSIIRLTAPKLFSASSCCVVVNKLLRSVQKPRLVSRSDTPVTVDWSRQHAAGFDLSAVIIHFRSKLFTNNDRHVTGSRPMRITHSRLLNWTV